MFKEACHSDAEQIANLVNMAYRPEPSAQGWTHESDLVSGQRTNAEQVANLIHANGTVLMAYEGNNLLGCVHVERAEPYCCIGMLATMPALQNQGLGKKLLAAAESLAVSRFGAQGFKMSVLSSRPGTVGLLCTSRLPAHGLNIPISCRSWIWSTARRQSSRARTDQAPLQSCNFTDRTSAMPTSTFKLIAALLALALAGCASAPKPEVDNLSAAPTADVINTPPVGPCPVWIYRNQTYFHLLNPREAFVYVNEERVSTIGVENFLPSTWKPGKYVVSIREPIFSCRE